jgi:hypothetical protein
LTPLAPERPYTGTPAASATSGNPRGVIDGKGDPWVAADDDANPRLNVDFGQPRDIGGIVVRWAKGSLGVHFDVEVSDNGATWTTVRRVRGAGLLPNWIALPDLQARWLRLAFNRSGGAPPPAVLKIEFLDPAAGASHNALWRARAARAARGTYPRTLLGEQSFWTVVGVPDDAREALINEQGQVEVDKRAFSLEPFIVRADGRLLTWSDASHEQALRGGWLPIPRVVRKHDGIEMTVTALAAGEAGASNLHVAYTLRNTSTAHSRGRLALALRPFQVLPPWQDLNITGGWTAVRSIRTDGSDLIVNEQKRVTTSPSADVTAMPYDAGDPVELMAARYALPKHQFDECPERSASAVLTWDFDLAPGATGTYLVCVPFHTTDAPADRPRGADEFERLASQVADDWKSRVDRATFTLPESARQFHDTIRATQAYVLINHDGDGFQPGSRTYERSWMRDGSMTSAAMLELGHTELVRRFIDWVAPFQFPSGKVPCVVDRRGADPVPEHDSNGQLIWLIANYHRCTRDDALVRRHFERVKATVSYVESLRAQRLTEEFGPSGEPRQEPSKPPVPALAFRGLVPESISHEGYSAKPMHSFWDQLFVLRGLDDAVYLANVVHESELAARWQNLADEFRTSVIESIRLAQRAHGIDYLPGCVELGDFDSTSSTILLWPVEEADNFPRAWIEATFERYWREFTRRRDAQPQTWEAYTPYELRHVNTLVRLGDKKRAWDALAWYFAHQRPAGWRHWAEVVHRDPKTPRMIGDMPHTWCGSDFLNAARTMFVYEQGRGDERRLVLFAGVPDAWLRDAGGVAFSNLRTEFGRISASAKPHGADRLVVRLDGDAHPPGGFELCLPTDRPIRFVRIDDRGVDSRDRVRIPALPATIEVGS